MINIATQPWNFPVALQNVFLSNGEEVPLSRAVVRTDQNKPICSVSNRYNLVPHSNVVDAALEYSKTLGFKGEPEIEFFNNGPCSTLTVQVTYRENTIEVKKGDYVGVRVYFSNSYNGKSSLTVRIGGLRLICLNGMVASKDIFQHSYRHSGEINIVMPDRLEVEEALGREGNKWKLWAQTPVLEDNRPAIINDLIIDKKIFGERQREALQDTWGNQNDATAWGLYNALTNMVTHQSGRLSEMGRIRKLDRVGRYVNELTVQ